MKIRVCRPKMDCCDSKGGDEFFPFEAVSVGHDHDHHGSPVGWAPNWRHTKREPWRGKGMGSLIEDIGRGESATGKKNPLRWAPLTLGSRQELN